MKRGEHILWRDWEPRTPYASGSYCTGASPLQPAHASSPTLPRSHTVKENNAHWALQCSPLLNVHQSLKFNYRKDKYMYYYLFINYTWTCSMIIILYVPTTAVMTLLIMHDFLLCGKWVDEWFIEIRDKLPIYINSAFLNLHGKKQTSFSCD